MTKKHSFGAVSIIPLLLVVFIFAALAIFITASKQQPPTNAATTKPIIGAIRFDAWSKENYRWFPNGGFRRLYSDYLSPQMWHYRVPFFGQILGTDQISMDENNQSVMDQEIQAAQKAGLSFWAFDFANPYWQNNPPTLPDGKPAVINYALNLYLASQYKSALNFSLIVFWAEQIPGTSTSLYWRQNTVTKVAQYTKDGSYQRVFRNRPLIFIFNAHGFWDNQGTTAKADLDYLRQQVQKATGANPYVVGMTWNGADSVISQLGFDAISAYASPVSGTATFNSGKPFAQLISANDSFRNAAKNAGYQVIPIVNVGWDRRPHWIDPEEAHGVWYERPTMAQIAQNLKNALSWIANNRLFAQANTALIYAWNEYTEGGWLGPSLLTGNDRLDTIAQVLGASPSATPPPATTSATITGGGISPTPTGWSLWVKGTNLTTVSQIQLLDNNQSPWAAPVTFAPTSNGTGGTFALPGVNPPSNCNQNASCIVSGQLLSAGLPIGKFPFTLGQTNSPFSTRINSSGVNTRFQPWFVWLTGTNLSPILKARLLDTNGSQWGSDLATGSDLNLSSLTFQLASNTPPSNCNVGKTCPISFLLVDPTGKTIGPFPLTLPAQ